MAYNTDKVVSNAFQLPECPNTQKAEVITHILLDILKYESYFLGLVDR